MFFFDTYAIFEILNGNPAYNKFQDEVIRTSILNLGELYYGFLKEGKKEMLDVWMDIVKPDLIEFSPETMKKAMLFRYANKKKKFSMTDCVGYVLAQKSGVPFVTGDSAFQGFPNVEFVK